MVRSLSFGSYFGDLIAISNTISFRLHKICLSSPLK